MAFNFRNPPNSVLGITFSAFTGIKACFASASVKQSGYTRGLSPAAIVFSSILVYFGFEMFVYKFIVASVFEFEM
jgi:hypothetical protein